MALRLQTNTALREEALLAEEADRTGQLLQKYQQQLLDLLAAMQSSRARFLKTMLSFAEVEKKVQAAQTLQRQRSEQRRRRHLHRARIKADKDKEKEMGKGKVGTGRPEESRDKDKEADGEADGEGGGGAGVGEKDLDEEQVGLAFVPGEHKENWMVRFINASNIGTADPLRPTLTCCDLPVPYPRSS